MPPSKARLHGRVCLIGVLVGIGIVSIWTPFMSHAIATRWFAWPNTMLSWRRCPW